MDRLTALAVFGCVVETGSLAAASRRLNMPATAIRAHVQALEERLGTRLLAGHARAVTLTEAGHAYYERSSRILADLEEADGVGGRMQAAPRGRLRLHALTAFAGLLSPVIAEYLTRNPAVTIDLALGDRTVDVIEDGFDLAIAMRVPPDAGLIARHLPPWRHILCCAPSYLYGRPAPTRPADLAHHACLRDPAHPEGADWHFITPEGRPVSVRVTGRLVANAPEMLRALARGGHGVILAPSAMVADDIEAGDLLPLLPDHRPADFALHAVYPHRRHFSPTVRGFIDLLATRCAEHRARLDPAASPAEPVPRAG